MLGSQCKAEERETGMKTLLIVFHSRTGGTRQMADAARRGAGLEPGAQVRLLTASEAQGSDVLAADGYIFATPENLARDGRSDEGILRPDILRRAGTHQRTALRNAHLRRQRRRERCAPDSTHRNRMAAPPDRRTADRLHTCPDAGGDPGAEDDRRRRSRPIVRKSAQRWRWAWSQASSDRRDGTIPRRDQRDQRAALRLYTDGSGATANALRMRQVTITVCDGGTEAASAPRMVQLDVHERRNQERAKAERFRQRRLVADSIIHGATSIGPVHGADNQLNAEHCRRTL